MLAHHGRHVPEDGQEKLANTQNYFFTQVGRRKFPHEARVAHEYRSLFLRQDELLLPEGRENDKKMQKGKKQDRPDSHQAGCNKKLNDAILSWIARLTWMRVTGRQNRSEKVYQKRNPVPHCAAAAVQWRDEQPSS